MSYQQTLMQFLGKKPSEATLQELYDATAQTVLHDIAPRWEVKANERRGAYFSAEFLIGRMVYSNLLNTGLYPDFEKAMLDHGVDPAIFEQVDDAALGNGGLGRLAACFLDSAASCDIPLDGYGIRYRYGLFRQHFEHGFQKEEADNWLRLGDPFSKRMDQDKVVVSFADGDIYAVPYDMPVIGYQKKRINTLRLWQSEPMEEIDFDLFNQQKYDRSVRERNAAERISYFLYPNDDTLQGKKLRLKQQYFFVSASLQDMMKKTRGFFEETHAIQLNDTHPVMAIPELIRLLMDEGVSFEEAIVTARRTFAYTNHTVMPEAMEKWSVSLIRAVCPQLLPVIRRIQRQLRKELGSLGVADFSEYDIIADGVVHMARMAVFCTHATNGVAKIHTEILKDSVLAPWHKVYPNLIQNKTNGITQRRWLALCNRELTGLIADKIGKGFIEDADQLKQLQSFAEDTCFLNRLQEIKAKKKQQLADFILKKEKVDLLPNAIYDVQVKRLHEYKRQLLNAFSILDTYFRLKEGLLPDFTPTVYLFGAKAAPGYFRAKGIIKYINEIGKLIASDPDVKHKMQVVFVSDYNVSYAEKIIPAADLSEQISTAGTEASGTGNMKLMLNGALTLGTYDGANIEIVEQAGEENNYIFGLTVEQVQALKDQGYDPKSYLDAQPRLKRVVDTLIDGTFDDGGTGMFEELHRSLLEGASWHDPDQYFLFADFIDYCDKRDQANRDYKDSLTFAKKRLFNIANAGYFSSDRTIKQYATDIWNIGKETSL